MNVTKTDDTSGGENQDEKDTTTGTDPAIEALKLTNQSLEKKLADQARIAQETTKKLQDLEKQKLEGTGDFKGLWEQERKGREEAEAKAARLSTGFVMAQKKVAATEALRKAGLNEEAIKLLHPTQFDSLVAEVDDSTGEIQVKGVDTLVADYRKQFPTLFGKAPPRVNGGGGGSGDVTDKPVTALDYLAIERKFGPRSPEAKAAHEAMIEQKKKQNSR